MALKSRKTLQAYFKRGSLPTEDQFKDLIDSMLNMIDEGFDKTPAQGLKVAQLAKKGKLISFFSKITRKDSPIWSIRIDLQSSAPKLSFLNKDDDEILTLTPDGKVGIKQTQPEFDLDVAGTIASEGRIGKRGQFPVLADGNWHDITDILDGCHAFEIMAGVGLKGTGKYALMRASALKTFDARGKIVYHQAHYGSRCNRLKLGWKKEANKQYRLQLKTRCCYGTYGEPPKPVEVKYYITRLWFDNRMQGCCP